MNTAPQDSAYDKITDADILRMIAAAFILGATVGILLTPVIDVILKAST